MIKFKSKIQILNILNTVYSEGWSNIKPGDIIELILPSDSNNVIIKNTTSGQCWENNYNALDKILSNNFVINQIK